jgi:ethanolamine transporter EutH
VVNVDHYGWGDNNMELVVVLLIMGLISGGIMAYPICNNIINPKKKTKEMY